MKKLLIVFVLVILLPLYLLDSWVHGWTEGEIKKIVAVNYPGAKVDVQVGNYLINNGSKRYMPSPMLPSLVVNQETPEVTITLSGSGPSLGVLPVDIWTFSADSLRFDSQSLFGDKNATIVEINRGAVQATIGQDSLSFLDPGSSIRVDSQGKASITKNGSTRELTMKSKKNSIEFYSDNKLLRSISTANDSLLPCAPKVSFINRGVLLSCYTSKAPRVIKPNGS